ncbi:SRPBCC family protein [Patulibacter minatonensis]|uniref:SRPBCC family protein n=1 Tax=Patulibacter minatonensis TaxID=298163 RepID=UPI0004B06A16|nr:SRPBCC family protein [Patulibacter minatonensis]
MPAHPLRHVDDAFLKDAPLVVRSSVQLRAQPSEVWEVLGSDEMWSWLPVIDRLEWQTPRPHVAGSVRRLRIGKFLTLDEEFYRWDTDRRATFRVVGQSRRVVDALIEDFLLVPSEGGTELTWTMAFAPLKGARLPLGLLAPVLRPGNTLAISGIKKLLR